MDAKKNSAYHTSGIYVYTTDGVITYHKMPTHRIRQFLATTEFI